MGNRTEAKFYRLDSPNTRKKQQANPTNPANLR